MLKKELEKQGKKYVDIDENNTSPTINENNNSLNTNIKPKKRFLKKGKLEKEIYIKSKIIKEKNKPERN